MIVNDEHVILKLVIESHKANIIFIENASFIKSLYLHRFLRTIFIIEFAECQKWTINCNFTFLYQIKILQWCNWSGVEPYQSVTLWHVKFAWKSVTLWCGTRTFIPKWRLQNGFVKVWKISRLVNDSSLFFNDAILLLIKLKNKIKIKKNYRISAMENVWEKSAKKNLTRGKFNA